MHSFKVLQDSLVGDLYTDEMMLTMLSTDASIYQIKPSAVVYPAINEDVIAVLKFAAENGLSVHARGAGSGLCGSAIGHGIILDFTRYMNRLIDMDADSMTFTCEPGYRYGELEEFLKGSGIFFPPAPSSGEYATFGGMYATNAGGAYSVKYGNVSDYLVDAEVIFADGRIRVLNDIANMSFHSLPENLKELYRLIEPNKEWIKEQYPKIPTNVCGYELRGVIDDNGALRLHKLLGGSEGTLAIVTKLTFSLKHKMKHSTLIVAYFDDIISSAKASQLALKSEPASIEIMDKSLLAIATQNDAALAAKIPSGYDNVLMIEFEGDDLAAVEQITKECMDSISAEKLSPNISLALNEEDKAQFWAVRKAAVPILYRLKGERKILALIEDAAVPSALLVEYFQGLYTILDKYSVKFALYGHIAKGLIHARPLLNMKDASDIELMEQIADDVFQLVMSLGGTISGEHGDGRLRSKYIPMQYKELFPYFVSIKELFDTKYLLNPDIITYSYQGQLKSDLRYGADYHAKEPNNTLLIWDGGFDAEVEKCHGCSKCTTVTNATRMCPIYKIARDEASAPKSKANLLRALISGRIEGKELYAKSFQSVMDRCINCGSCSAECPSKVNIPKMALEARSKYAEKYGVPLEYQLVTRFELFARLTRKLFPVVNPIMKLKLPRIVAEKFAGMAHQRDFVRFEFNSIYERYSSVIGAGNKKALYFVGCYASYIRPDIAESSINVLNRLGYQVLLPEQHCCGIPHLSKGMADGAREKIEENLREWGKLIDEVDCIVVSCSSCGLALVQEWGYYMGGELIEKIKQKTKHISSIVKDNVDKFNLEQTGIPRVAYHTPCHMKLLPDSGASWAVLSKVGGAGVVNLKSGCCGIAGSWGVSAKHYEESVKIGEKLSNLVEDSGCELCVTDCPTCEMQLNHLSDKKVYHPIEIFNKLILRDK